MELKKLDDTIIDYKGSKIRSFKYEWEEENENGKKNKNTLYRRTSTSPNNKWPNGRRSAE